MGVVQAKPDCDVEEEGTVQARVRINLEVEPLNHAQSPSGSVIT